LKSARQTEEKKKTVNVCDILAGLNVDEVARGELQILGSCRDSLREKAVCSSTLYPPLLSVCSQFALHYK